MQKPDSSTPARIVATAIEELIRKNQTETGVLIAPDGTVFGKRHGRPDKVSFPHGELLQARGMTFTHNHPNGYAHSLSDMSLAIFYGMHEVRVVTPDFRHIASMLKPEHLGPLERSFGRVQASVMSAVQDDVKRGLVNQRDFSHEVRHRTWQRLSAEIGFDYRRHE
jgi:hypothetical protein